VKPRKVPFRLAVSSLATILLFLGLGALVASPRFPLSPLYALPSLITLEKVVLALAVLGGVVAFFCEGSALVASRLLLSFGFLAIWKNGPIYLETVLSDIGVEGVPISFLFLLVGFPALALSCWARSAAAATSKVWRRGLLCLGVLVVFQLLTVGLIYPLDPMERSIQWMTVQRAFEAILCFSLLAKARSWEVGFLGVWMGLMLLVRWGIQWGGAGP